MLRPPSCQEEVYNKGTTWKGRSPACHTACRLCSVLRVPSFGSRHPCWGGPWGHSYLQVISAPLSNSSETHWLTTLDLGGPHPLVIWVSRQSVVSPQKQSVTQQRICLAKGDQLHRHWPSLRESPDQTEQGQSPTPKKMG